MVPVPSSPLVSSGSHGSHGPSTPLSSSSSSIPLTIGLWNANGLQESTADDLLRHCQSFSLVFITETWLLPPHRIRTSWTQFNLYGSPVVNSYRGSQGVSALVSPSCPMAVVQFPVQDNWHFRPRWINHDIYGSIGAITTFQIWKYIFLVIAHRLVPFSFSNSDYLL
ncbi:hypothetical protein G6F47_012996 [Rhizopus delemar]|nr:hypothetical protein G6F53_013129 [Rhizopus delemar]KAG1576219.1 hypothetical protein G6F48_013167 [Rhizopus delemar]KAG1577789.1 hypothetical protein G6F47_012996 [Rhizopus delemar]